MKRICIDVRFFGINHTGIGRYAENLVLNLPKSDDIKVVLITGKDCQVEAKKTGYKVYVAKHHPYSLLAQFEMPMLLAKIKPDLVHFTHFFVPIFWWGRFVVTIHDLIKHESRGLSVTTRNPLIYWLKHWGYMFTVWFAVIRARKIIVPANYWKEKIATEYHLNKNKIAVTYEGVSHDFAV